MATLIRSDPIGLAAPPTKKAMMKAMGQIWLLKFTIGKIPALSFIGT
jgi:hypothetical protein